MQKLNDQEVIDLLALTTNWNFKEEKWIKRKFVFKEFLTGISFVNEIANLSEELNHHPFIEIQYKTVIVSLTSWHARGLTALDFKMASQIEDIYKEL